MKVSIPIGLCCLTVTAVLSGSAFSASTPRVNAKQLEAVETNVIVIMRDQLSGTPAVRGNMMARRSAVVSAQAPILAELQQARATRIHSFGLINAVATRVPKSEVARLAAHPLVQAVVPDRVIRVVRRDRSSGSSSASVGVMASNAPKTNSPTVDPLTAICPSDPASPLLEPEALQLTHTAFHDTSTPAAQQLVDGSGVKVAFIADGLDINNPDFIRANGEHVFVDYEDFSGDGLNAPTESAEAFGDASSIAAQGRQVYDLSNFVNPAHPLPPGCNITVRGMAPGASLVGLKVFTASGSATTSGIVQAIEYAVNVAHVDVINESFGGNPYPDNDNDPISLADEAAVSAGISVVTSTGDAGTAGTLGSPSTDSDVIAVGATTQYRLYAQTTNSGFQLGSGGFLSNNISALSSGGFAQTAARTVDVVAPGDLGWALCTPDQTLYFGCSDFKGAPTGIQDFGGTSESSPLTAGEAALVIEAYRNTHNGVNPTPALVKRIIMSTATDLGAPASEQGAGLINALGAVYAALSIDDANGHPKNQGDSLVALTTSAHAEDIPHTSEARTFTLRNTGTTVQRVTPKLQMLGQPFAGQTFTIALNPATDPSYINATGSRRTIIRQQFNVPAGADHLDVAIAFQPGLSPGNPPIVYMQLFTPTGQLAQYSIPQGFGSGYGHVDVNHPAAGTWTAFVGTRPSGGGSYTGPVQFTWSAERYVSLGHVYPSLMDLQPGGSVQLTALFNMPAHPGDDSAVLRLGPGVTQGGSAAAAIPVTLRTLVDVGSNGGSFTGTLTGGNARPGAGPTQTFAFDVPRNAQNIGVNVNVSDSGYNLEGVLVDPHGMQMSVQPNIDPDGNATLGLQSFHYRPQAGRWRFVLLQNFTSSGKQTSLPFTSHISFYNDGQAASGNVPNSTGVRLSASGAPVTIPIHVTNNGIVPQLYFIDARLATPALVELGAGQCGNGWVAQGGCAFTYLPPEASAAQFIVQSASTPLGMDAFNVVGAGPVGGTGAPDVLGQPVGGANTVAATFTASEVPWGPWEMLTSLIGPFDPSGAPVVPIAADAFAVMKPFDSAISSSAGNIWADILTGSSTFDPLVLAPGQKGVINVTITPNPANVGKNVSGFLYLETINGASFGADEVVRIPYSYKVVN